MDSSDLKRTDLPDDTAVKPYKGAESYQPEDGDLFFGRDREADELISYILSSRLTVLHAPSGAGKTSLLNARMIPRLEMKGWFPVRVVPQDNPIQSIRAGAVQQLLPSPNVERSAVERLSRDLSPDASIEDCLDAYDDLPVSDRRKREWVSPLSMDSGDDEAQGKGRVRSFFCRLVQGTVGLRAFKTHLAALLSAVPETGMDLEIHEGTRLGYLMEILGGRRVGEAYARWMTELDVPVHGLLRFFRNILSTWGALHPDYAVVLIIDQFEELFTRYADVKLYREEENGREMPDWRLRHALFQELQALYTYTVEAEPVTDDREGMVDAAPRHLPLRMVLSLRDEYVARLDPIRLFAGTLDQRCFHLDFIAKNEAEAVIRKPARIFGYDYSDSCFEKIVGDLTREDRVIEPAHIQVVCEKLWRHAGHDFFTNAAKHSSLSPATADRPVIDLATFENELGGTREILRAHFREFLEAHGETSVQLEILDILEPLITLHGTRNVMEQSELIEVPLRDRELRQELLSELRKRSIVRVEARYGGHFAEITHEFLIQPILIEIQERVTGDVEESQFRIALETVTRFRNRDIRSREEAQISGRDFASLVRNWSRISWTDWASELMLRNAILHGVDRETFLLIAGTFEKNTEPFDVAKLRESIPSRRVRRWYLDLFELQALRHDGSPEDLEPHEVAFALESALSCTLGRPRDEVRFWTQEHSRSHGTNHAVRD